MTTIPIDRAAWSQGVDRKVVEYVAGLRRRDRVEVPSGIPGVVLYASDHILLYGAKTARLHSIDHMVRFASQSYVCSVFDEISTIEFDWRLNKDQIIARMRQFDCQPSQNWIDILDWDAMSGFYGDYTCDTFHPSDIEDFFWSSFHQARRRLKTSKRPLLRIASQDCGPYQASLTNPVSYSRYERLLLSRLEILTDSKAIQLCYFEPDDFITRNGGGFLTTLRLAYNQLRAHNVCLYVRKDGQVSRGPLGRLLVFCSIMYTAISRREPDPHGTDD